MHSLLLYDVGIVAVEMGKTLLATSPVEFTLYGCEKYPIVHNPRIYSEIKNGENDVPTEPQGGNVFGL